MENFHRETKYLDNIYNYGFFLVMTLSVEFDRTTKEAEIICLEKKIKKYLQPRDYGFSICNYYMGFICVSPGFDQFFQIKRPRYIEDKYVCYEKVLGKTHIYRSLSVDIKIDFHLFINSSIKEGLQIVAKAIIDRVSTMKYPAKVKDFDKERFLNDLIEFFKEEGIM